MPRAFAVSVLVFSLVLNGCASSPHSAQPEAPAEQRIVWNPPAEKPKGALRDWSKEHPWLAGTTVALLGVVSLAVLIGAPLAYAAAMAASQNRG